MQKYGYLLLASALCAAAQTPLPTINPDGIVRDDTGRPGLLSPGIVFSIYGRGFGPSTGCRGAALELCGVRVLVDDKPIEVQYAQEVQISARMPDGAPGQSVSRLTIVSRGRASDPVEVRRLPATATIALDGVARVDGPVWIHVELSPTLGVSYPSMARPWDFACDQFEVRKEGKLLPPLPHPQLPFLYSGPACPGTIALHGPEGRKSRLPLHLRYRFAEPGIYEIRLSHYESFFQRDEIRMQSAWTPVEVLPAISRSIATHPEDAAEILSSFLPDLLALPDDEALSVVLEYLYHPNPRVRAYAADALYYWPDSVVEPRLMAALRANGPAPSVPHSAEAHAPELLEAALPWFSSDDPVRFKGAIAAARNALSPAVTIGAELRSRLEQAMVAAARNLERADGQTINDFISVLGQIKDKQVHEALWSLVVRRTGTEQALIAIAWQKDASDLPRLADLLTAVPADAQPGQTFFGVPNAMRAQFGDAALPWLRTVLEKTPSPDVRIRCAEELMRGNDPSAFAFAQDALENNRAWKASVRTMVNDQFPETRNKSDAEMAGFLRDRRR